MNNLILVRHGQSQWNKEKRFTGWADIDLTEQGREEAKYAGKLIRELKKNILRKAAIYERENQLKRGKKFHKNSQTDVFAKDENK